MIKKYDNLEELLDSLDEDKKKIVTELMNIISKVCDIKPYINWHFIIYKRKRSFLYINPYNKFVYVWFSNAKRLISINPFISWLFDQVMWYNAKQIFRSIDEIESKHFKDLISFSWKVYLGNWKFVD